MPYGVSSAYAAQDILKKKAPTKYSFKSKKLKGPGYSGKLRKFRAWAKGEDVDEQRKPIVPPSRFGKGMPYSPYKMKGTPMKRNFGVGDSDMPDKEGPLNYKKSSPAKQFGFLTGLRDSITGVASSLGLPGPPPPPPGILGDAIDAASGGRRRRRRRGGRWWQDGKKMKVPKHGEESHHDEDDERGGGRPVPRSVWEREFAQSGGHIPWDEMQGGMRGGQGTITDALLSRHRNRRSHVSKMGLPGFPGGGGFPF